ncbi:MAG: hypothetical protein KDA60_00360 [Planctomycetales bacterium]|nr:hypothetical protein [Planctomycetales bacterium]
MKLSWNQSTRQQLAVYWSTDTLYYLLVKRQANKQVLLAADQLALEDGNAPDEIENHLRPILQQFGRKRTELSVVLARHSVELLPLSLPMTNIDQLPELVELQVLQQLPEYADDAVIDFVPTGEPSTDAQQILAVIARTSHVDTVQHIAARLKVPLAAIGVRPLAAAASLLKSVPTNKRIIAISQTGEEVDVNILLHQRLVLTRTVRIATDIEKAARTLVSEVQRTLLLLNDASHDDNRDNDNPDLSDEASTEIWLNLDSSLSGLDQHLTERLQLPVRYYDALAQLKASEHTPHGRGPYLPLLGAIAVTDERADAISNTASIDLLHPRRPTKQASPWKRYATYAAIVASALAFGGWYLRGEMRQLELEAAGLQSQLKTTTTTVKKLQSKQLVVTSLERWQQDDINWLDELQQFAASAPSAGAADFQRWNAASVAGSGGIISLDVRVKDPAVLGQLEDSVRDERHSIHSQRVTEQESNEAWPWKFESTIVVKRASSAQDGGEVAAR